MAVQVFPPILYEDYLAIRYERGLQPISDEEFQKELTYWYGEFQAGNCSLGYAAEQIGIGQIDFIYFLDQLGWKATNL